MNNIQQIKYNVNDPSDAKGNSYFAVVLANMAYKTQSEIEQDLIDVGYQDTKVQFFRSPLATGFIIEWDDVLAISFRGSITWREWLNNFNCWPRYTDYGLVHAGFYNTIENIGPTRINRTPNILETASGRYPAIGIVLNSGIVDRSINVFGV